MTTSATTPPLTSAEAVDACRKRTERDPWHVRADRPGEVEDLRVRLVTLGGAAVGHNLGFRCRAGGRPVPRPRGQPGPGWWEGKGADLG